MATLDSLLVKVGADISDYTRKMSTVESKTQKTLKTMAVAGAGLTAAVTAPLVLLGKKALGMAMDTIEAENLFTVTMGNMAESARKWSNQTAKALGLNAYGVRKYASTMNAMIKPMVASEQAALEMSQGLTQLAFDMASFYNLNPEEAFQKLQAGITGEAEPLKRLGIVINDTAIKAWALTTGMIRQGEVMTEEQKIIARYGLIMDRTSQAQGDLARTMDSPTNKLRMLRARVEEVTTSFGMLLIPAFSSAIDWVQGFVDKLSAMDEEQKKSTLTMLGLAAAAGPLMLLGSGLVTSYGNLATVFSKIWPVLKTTNILYYALAAAVIYLYKESEVFREIVRGVWEIVSGSIGAAWKIIKGIFEAFARDIALMKEELIAFWGKVKENFGNVVDFLAKIFAPAWEVIKTVFKTVYDVGSLVFSGIWEGLKMSFDNVVTFLYNVFAPAFNFIKGVWEGLQTVAQVTGSIVATAIQSIRDKFPFIDSILTKLSNIISKAKDAIDWVRRATGLSVPSVPVNNTLVGGQIPAFATGGIVTGPTLGLVGEAGPEAIIPLDKLGSIMRGQQAPVVNIYLDGEDITEQVNRRQGFQLIARGR